MLPRKSKEGMAITEYTSEAYQKINGALRKQGVPLSPEMEELVKNIESGASKLPTFLREEPLYRGSASDIYKYQDICPGKVFCDPAFLSVSKNKDIAVKDFGGEDGVLFMITCRKEGKAIKAYSEIPEEDEVLFPPSTRFMITKVEGKHVWMTELLESEDLLVVDPSGGFGFTCKLSDMDLPNMDDDDFDINGPPPPPCSTPKPTLVNDDWLGSVTVNGKRRSARHQEPIGSIFQNGCRRSARLMKK